MSSLAVNDYVFYKIVCIDEAVDFSYVGSTRNLHARKNDHRTCCNNPKGKKYNSKKYQIIRANGGWENFKFVEIGQREQITKREAEHIEEEYRVNLKANMNGVRCYVTEEQAKEQKKQANKEYNQNNKEKMSEYYQTNKEQIKEKKKKYHETHKEEINAKRSVKIKCECGCQVRKSNISSHRKTPKHLDLMKINNE